MAEIINLQKKRPHMTGDALCLQCSYKWVAVAPIGFVELECPECGIWKGVFIGMTAPETVYQCECGNQHFYIDDHEAMCAKCGLRLEDF